jgi:hypothetical protein
MGTIILSVLVAHTAWHWMLDRADVLSGGVFPMLTAATFVAGLAWACGLGVTAVRRRLAGTY